LSATDEAQRWFRQADADLAAARAVQEAHPYVACFLANLDRMYIEARYPDVLPDTTPAEYFTPEHAAEAIRQAETIVGAAKRLRRREPRQQSRDGDADRER